MGPGVDPDVIELLPFLPNYELYYNVSFLGTDFCTHPTKQDCGFSPDPLTAVPGPGEYDIDRKELNRTSSRPTSSFVCPRTHPSAETITETPAPGSYELWHVQPQYVDKCGQVLRDPFFRSQTKRMASFIAKSDVPGPGEYDVDRGLASLKGALGIGAGGVKGSGTVVKRSGQQQQSGGRSKEEVDVTPGEILFCVLENPLIIENACGSQKNAGLQREFGLIRSFHRNTVDPSKSHL